MVAAHALSTPLYYFATFRAFAFEKVRCAGLGNSSRIGPLDVKIGKASTSPSTVSEPRVIKFFSHAGWRTDRRQRKPARVMRHRILHMWAQHLLMVVGLPSWKPCKVAFSRSDVLLLLLLHRQGLVEGWITLHYLDHQLTLLYIHPAAGRLLRLLTLFGGETCRHDSSFRNLSLDTFLRGSTVLVGDDCRSLSFRWLLEFSIAI